MDEFLVRSSRAFAACEHLRNSRTTDSLRQGRMGEFLARSGGAFAACAHFEELAHNGLAPAGQDG